MKKLLKLLLVRRPETKDKWWHRLVLVLIYGSTIVGAIFFAILLVSEQREYWISESYTAYSFEQGYEDADGKEINCSFSVIERYSTPLFFCGDLSPDSNFLDEYFRAQGIHDRLQEVREEKSLELLQSINKTRVILNLPTRKTNWSNLSNTEQNAVDDEIIIELIQGGELDDIKVKRAVSFEYATFIGNWGLYLLFVFGWLVFWESIVYRTVLFIAYGRNHKS